MSLLTKGRGLQTLSHEYFVTMVISETSSRLSQSWKLNKSTCQWNKPPRFLMLKKLEQVRWSVLLDKHCTYSQWLTQFDVPAAERSRQKFSQNFHWKVISSFSRPLNVCLFRNVERIQNLIVFFFEPVQTVKSLGCKHRKHFLSSDFVVCASSENSAANSLYSDTSEKLERTRIWKFWGNLWLPGI